MPIEFKGEPKNIFGVKWQQITDDQILAIHLSPEATIIAIVEEIGLEDKNSVQNPYMSGCSVDKIPSVDHLPPLQITSSTRANPVISWLPQLARMLHVY